MGTGAYFLFFAFIFVAASASAIVQDLVQTYKEILAKPSFEDIINLHDDDASCSARCKEYLQQQIGVEPSWDRLEAFIDSIYGDMIKTDPYAPQEIKLALTGDITGDSSEMKVMWTTALPLENPIVEFQISYEDNGSNRDSSSSDGNDNDNDIDNVAITAEASSYTYTVPHNWWPTFQGTLYDAHMDDLIPDARYLYRVGGCNGANNTMLYSDYFSFRAPRASFNEPDQSSSIALLADHGTFMLLGFMVADKLAAMQDELSIDVVHVVGDLSYAGLSTDFERLNFTKEDEFERIWDLYGIQMQRTAATRPFMVTNGNHERFYDWAGYKNRFHMPYQKSGGSPDGFWYSYDYSNMHFVSISSEHSLDSDSEQYTWLQKDLKNAQGNRYSIPWIIVGIHKPLYCSDKGTPEGYRELLEPLMIDMDVDLLVSGHLHAYERIHPVNNYQVTVYPSNSGGSGGDDDGDDVYYSKGFGPVHVVQGNSGAMQFENWNQPQPAWSAFRYANGYITRNITKYNVTEIKADQGLLPSNYTDTFGFGVVSALNSTHLKYQMIPITGDIGKDTFWIVKER